MPGFFAGLMAGLLFSLFHAVHYPGKFILTYCSLALAAFLLIALAFPVALRTPSMQLIDSSPVKQGRFLALADESKIYQPDNLLSASQGQFYHYLVFVPAQDKPMTLIKEGQFDPLNKRFLLSAPVQAQIPLKDLSPEQDYFGFPELIKSFHLDFFKLYLVLKNTWEIDPVRFYMTALCLTLLLMGLLFFFSLKTWPLIQWIFVLLVLRLMIYFAAFCLWEIPVMVEPWFSPTSAQVYKVWTPIFILGLSGSVLFFMSLLTKPHRKSKP